MHSQKMNIELMKQFNTASVLRIIRFEGPISRAEIADKMDLSRPSVSEIVSELLTNGWIRETAINKGGRGRPSVPLEIYPNGRYAIGVELGAYHVTVVLCNLRADILRRETIAVNSDSTPDVVLESICVTIEKNIEGYQLNRDKLLGVGVAMHGVVDPRQGVSIFAPILGWRNVAIREYLETRLKLTTVVENDCNSSALGEQRFGNGRGENFITLLVDYGIGSGIITEGRIFRGVHNIEGQIGHITVDEDGPQCACGNYGCLEVMASEPAIVRQAQKRLRRGEKSIMGEDVELQGGNLSIADVYRAARMDDSLAVDILSKAGRYLGIGIANLINLFDPEFLILGGGIREATDIVIPSIQEITQRKVLGDSAKRTPIIASKLGANLYPVGAVALILERAFEAPVSFEGSTAPEVGLLS